MQAAVSICIIGPIGDRNGEVEVRSVHVNWPGGLAGATWPLHDPDGYSEAERSMSAYGRANFSKLMLFLGVHALDTDQTIVQVLPNASVVRCLCKTGRRAGLTLRLQPNPQGLEDMKPEFTPVHRLRLRICSYPCLRVRLLLRVRLRPMCLSVHLANLPFSMKHQKYLLRNHRVPGNGVESWRPLILTLTWLLSVY